MSGEVRCYRCSAITPLEGLSGFDVLSLPNGKEVVRKRFGVVDAKMYLVSLCPPCYEEAQSWISVSAEGK